MAELDLFQGDSGSGKEINIKAILYKYLRYWYLFAIGTVLSIGGAILYLRYATPQYTISSTLLIKEDKSGSMFSGGEGFSDLGIFQTNKNLDNEIEILRSKSLMERVLKELALQTSCYQQGQVRDMEIYGDKAPIKVITKSMDSPADKTISIRVVGSGFELIDEDESADVKENQYKFGQEIRKPYATFTVVAIGNQLTGKEFIIQFHDTKKLAYNYNKKLIISTVNKEVSVINISMTDAIRQKGVDIIAKLIEVYNKEAIEDKNQMAANTIEFIDDRLTHLTEELTNVEKDVEQYKQRNELTDVNSESQLYLETASEYNKQLADFAIQIDVLNSIETYLSNQANQYKLVPSSLSIQDPTLLGLIGKFNELQLERERMLRTTQPNNPLVQAMNDQLGNLRANILENLKNIKNGLVITGKNLRANSDQFESRIQQVPLMERELMEINRQQSIKQELYLFLLTKREEAGLSLASTISNSRIIDPPVAEDIPVSPKTQSVLLAALILGLGLPFAFIYVKEMLNDKVTDRKDVEHATNTPVLGEIIHSMEKTPLQVKEGNWTPIAEIFRLMRANLQFATLGKENKVIMITSSCSGEGKTFFSINLGASLALSGKKVIILSFDLRKPKLMQDLNLTTQIGITNYLISDDFSVEALTVSIKEVPGLFVMGSGPIPPNPAELMLGNKVLLLMNELKKQYDYIILDSSPVGQVADTFNLAPYADSTLYVVRYNYTFKSQLAIIDDIYQNKKLKHPMVVMNDAKKKNMHGYGYGYGYGYGNNYNNGNGEKTKKGKSPLQKAKVKYI